MPNGKICITMYYKNIQTIRWNTNTLSRGVGIMRIPKIPWSWILILFLIVNIVAMGRSQWITLDPANATISELDAQNIVKERYQGTVKKINLDNQLYYIEFEKGNEQFKIKLDSVSGGVISFEKKEG